LNVTLRFKAMSQQDCAFEEVSITSITLPDYSLFRVSLYRTQFVTPDTREAGDRFPLA